MARTAGTTASILKELYDEDFGRDCAAPFRLTWDQLRLIAGVGKLTDDYLTKLSKRLLEDDYALLVFNNTFIVGTEEDFYSTRSLPARLAEHHLFNEKEDGEDGDYSEDEEDEDDLEIDDNDPMVEDEND